MSLKYVELIYFIEKKKMYGIFKTGVIISWKI